MKWLENSNAIENDLDQISHGNDKNIYLGVHSLGIRLKLKKNLPVKLIFSSFKM